MCKNKVQFQAGYSLIKLFKNYGAENQCVEALSKWRWPAGFRCPHCGLGRHSVVKTRKPYQCTDCHHQASLISGTIFEQTKLPLATWSLATHLVTQAKTGLPALALKRQVGVPYNTAWGMEHKVMRVVKARGGGKPLSGTIQLDGVHGGGERRGGKRGRGPANKGSFVAAVSPNEAGHPIATDMKVVKGFRLAGISRWAKRHLQPNSTVISDGLPCFSAVTGAGRSHIGMVTGGGPQSVTNEAFAWTNTLTGKVIVPSRALAMRSAPNIYRVILPNSATGIIDGSNWKTCCPALLMWPCGRPLCQADF